MRRVFGEVFEKRCWFYSCRLRASLDHVKGTEVFVGSFYQIDEEIDKMSNEIRPRKNDLSRVDSLKDVAVNGLGVDFA